MSDNRVERKCSRKWSLKRLPVSPMYILSQERHLIAYTTFSLKQVYLDWTVMCPPGVAIEADALVCAQVLHRVRLQVNVPRSSLVAVVLSRCNRRYRPVPALLFVVSFRKDERKLERLPLSFFKIICT